MSDTIKKDTVKLDSKIATDAVKTSSNKKKKVGGKSSSNSGFGSKKTSAKFSSNSSNFKETYKVQGKEIYNKIKEIIKKGNAKKVLVKDENNKVILVIPLTAGIVGFVLAPYLGAIGVIVALSYHCTIEVEK